MPTETSGRNPAAKQRTECKHDEGRREGVDDAGHDLANLPLELRKEGSRKEGRDQAARAGVVDRASHWQYHLTVTVGRKQRHSRIGHADGSRDASQDGRPTKLPRRIVASEYR